MFAVETNQVVNSDVQSQAVEVFLSHGFGVSFADDNSVAANQAVLDALKNIEESVPGDIVKDNGLTSFTVNVQELSQFLHLVYCHTPEGKELVVRFDGLYPFDALDETGTMRKFNAQLVTISEETVH